MDLIEEEERGEDLNDNRIDLLLSAAETTSHVEVAAETVTVIPLQPFQAIDISLGSDINSAVQEDLRHGMCGVTADVAVIAEHAGSPINEPALGMNFTSALDMLAMCHSYAKQTGFQFSIRTSAFFDSETTTDDGAIKTSTKKKKKRTAAGYMDCKVLRLKCKRGGTFQSKSRKLDHVPTTQKTGCLVAVEGARCADGFRIRACNLDHNHDMNGERSRLMVNYRVIGIQEQERLLTNHYAGIPMSKNYKSLSVWVGGPANLKFSENDAKNFLKSERREGKINGDAMAMLAYFDKQTLTNSDFYSAYQTDSNGKLLNVFWADARSRAAFKSFGEVVTFDTTHVTNDYGMPFAFFVGINQHGSSIIFAFALISNEDATSFCWIFEQWLKCMGKPPAAFLSDQCRGIKRAVGIVFPGITHRLCIWHILQNARKNLGSRTHYQKVYDRIKTAVHDSVSLEEFEVIWCEMVEEFGLEDCDWIQEAYAIRERWVPGHWRDTFWAGMSSTQRSEQMNRFFKGYVNNNTGLIDFLREVDRALARKAEKQVQLNNESFERPLHHGSSSTVVKVFHAAYTNKKFLQFYTEFRALGVTNATLIEKHDDIVLYDVAEKIETPRWRVRWRTFQVSIDEGAGNFLCSCKMFQFTGILCKHILKAMHMENIDYIPCKYVLDRWRKNIARDYERIKLSYCDPHRLLHLQKYHKLANLYDQITSIVISDDDAYKLAVDEATSSLLKFQAASVLSAEFVNIGTSEDPNTIDLRIFGRRKIVTPGIENCEDIPETVESTDKVDNPRRKKKGHGRPEKKRKKPAHELGAIKKAMKRKTLEAKLSANMTIATQFAGKKTSAANKNVVKQSARNKTTAAILKKLKVQQKTVKGPRRQKMRDLGSI